MGLVGNRRLLKSDALHIAAQKPHLFPVVLPQHLGCFLRYREKVRCVGLKFHIGQGIDDPVKSGGGDVLDQACGLILRPHHADDPAALLKFPHNLRQAFRRMLQVSIHADDAISVRIVDARDHGRLMAKVAGEGYHLHLLVPSRILSQNREAVVPAAIVDKQELIIPGKNLQDQLDRLIKHRQCLFFIVYRYHYR